MSKIRNIFLLNILQVSIPGKKITVVVQLEGYCGMISPARWCGGESVRIAVSRPGVRSLSRVIPKDFKKWYSQLPCWALSIKKRIVWRTSRQACLLCPWARHLTGSFHLYVADRWPTRTLPVYNCEVANSACRERQLVSTHRWQFALLLVGLPVTQDWFEMGCHLSPCLIQLGS